MMLIIGIDPGIKGGIAWFRQGLHGCVPMPTTPRQTYLLLSDLATSLNVSIGTPKVFIEKCHSMPKQGVASTFQFGKGIGILLGILTAIGAEINEITPQAWKKVVLAGTDKSKDAAILFVENHFKEIDLFPGRSRKAHDGMADAACLMEYGKRAQR